MKMTTALIATFIFVTIAAIWFVKTRTHAKPVQKNTSEHDKEKAKEFVNKLGELE